MPVFFHGILPPLGIFPDHSPRALAQKTFSLRQSFFFILRVILVRVNDQ